MSWMQNIPKLYGFADKKRMGQNLKRSDSKSVVLTII